MKRNFVKRAVLTVGTASMALRAVFIGLVCLFTSGALGAKPQLSILPVEEPVAQGSVQSQSMRQHPEIQAFLRSIGLDGGQGSTIYSLGPLDGQDGAPMWLAGVKASQVCGPEGCPYIILKQAGGRFELVDIRTAKAAIVPGPSNGIYRDIVYDTQAGLVTGRFRDGTYGFETEDRSDAPETSGAQESGVSNAQTTPPTSQPTPDAPIKPAGEGQILPGSGPHRLSQFPKLRALFEGDADVDDEDNIDVFVTGPSAGQAGDRIIAVQFRGLYSCGNRGCSGFVYREKQDGSYEELDAHMAFFTRLGSGANNGYRDLILDMGTGSFLYQFDGKAYQYVGDLPSRMEADAQAAREAAVAVAVAPAVRPSQVPSLSGLTASGAPAQPQGERRYKGPCRNGMAWTGYRDDRQGAATYRLCDVHEGYTVSLECTHGTGQLMIHSEVETPQVRDGESFLFDFNISGQVFRFRVKGYFEEMGGFMAPVFDPVPLDSGLLEALMSGSSFTVSGGGGRKSGHLSGSARAIETMLSGCF